MHSTRLDGLLFSGTDSFTIEDGQLRAAEAEIGKIGEERFLNSNVDDLVAYVVEKYRIDVPELDEGTMTVDQHEARHDVSRDPARMAYHMDSGGPVYAHGIEVVVEVHFSGDAALFSVRPKTSNFNPPRADVRGNQLLFRCWSDSLTPAQLRAEVDSWLADLRRYLAWQREGFKSFNDTLPTRAHDTIRKRRERLLANQNLVAELGIPLKRRPGNAISYPARELKRKIVPHLPPATAGEFRPEPALEEEAYQHILTVIEGMVKVMERSPKAFHDIDEESLRTHFLVQLNGHYEGQATGETFNYQGKTDILVRSGDRNIFIAECKFWDGPAALSKTIDQLLGYLSWRDSKGAILIFNRNKDFSKVLEAIPGAVRAHPHFHKDEGKRGETGFRYAFRHKDDPAKDLHLTILAFDVPRSAT